MVRLYLLNASDEKAVQPAEVYAEACFRCDCNVGPEFAVESASQNVESGYGAGQLPESVSAGDAALIAAAINAHWRKSHQWQNVLNVTLTWIEGATAIGCIIGCGVSWANNGLVVASTWGCLAGFLACITASVTINHALARYVWNARIRRLRGFITGLQQMKAGARPQLQSHGPEATAAMRVIAASRLSLHLVVALEMGRVASRSDRRRSRGRQRHRHRSAATAPFDDRSGRASTSAQPHHQSEQRARARDIAREVVYVQVQVQLQPDRQQGRGGRDHAEAANRMPIPLEAIPVARLAPPPPAASLAQLQLHAEQAGLPTAKVVGAYLDV